MRDRELIEQVTYVPYDDFLRAHHLITTPDQALSAIDVVLDRIRKRPEDDFIMGPDFLAVLALFSAPGTAIAEANMSRDEISFRQRELARKISAIAYEFPSLLSDGT